jgi:hypothetical protein
MLSAKEARDIAERKNGPPQQLVDDILDAIGKRIADSAGRGERRIDNAFGYRTLISDDERQAISQKLLQAGYSLNHDSSISW